MSTMSELHIRTQDELDYLAEVDHHNQTWMREQPSAVDHQPVWYLKLRGAVADRLYSTGFCMQKLYPIGARPNWYLKLRDAVSNGLCRLANKIDHCPF